MISKIFSVLLVCAIAARLTSRLFNPYYNGPADLAFIYNQIKENHPGIYNTEDPGFPTHLEAAYTHYAAQLQHKSPAAQQEIITTFMKTFHDGHLGVKWDANPWKGFSTDAPFTLKHIDLSTVWITLPIFINLTQEQEEGFQRIEKLLPSLAQGHTIIFNLNPGRGGNSEYGDRIANALFGAEYTQYYAALATARETVDWRASQENITYFENALHTLSALQQSWISPVISGMKKSLAGGEPYYHETWPMPAAQVISHSVTSKIIVITYSSNGSAFLDFIDRLKMMNYPITLIGKTTSADRCYMEVHPTLLPSKKGNLWLPIKVYRNRFRDDNEPYTPDIAYDGDMNDNEALQQFVLQNLRIIF